MGCDLPQERELIIMEKKMTKREMFAQIIKNYNLTNEEVEFLNHEIDLISRKSGANRKPSAKQVANIEFGDKLFEEMEVGRAYKCSELAKIYKVTPQKISPILKRLVGENKVSREEVKGVTLFTKC